MALWWLMRSFSENHLKWNSPKMRPIESSMSSIWVQPCAFINLRDFHFELKGNTTWNFKHTLDSSNRENCAQRLMREYHQTLLMLVIFHRHITMWHEIRLVTLISPWPRSQTRLFNSIYLASKLEFEIEFKKRRNAVNSGDFTERFYWGTKNLKSWSEISFVFMGFTGSARINMSTSIHYI